MNISQCKYIKYSPLSLMGSLNIGSKAYTLQQSGYWRTPQGKLTNLKGWEWGKTHKKVGQQAPNKNGQVSDQSPYKSLKWNVMATHYTELPLSILVLRTLKVEKKVIQTFRVSKILSLMYSLLRKLLVEGHYQNSKIKKKRKN